MRRRRTTSGGGGASGGAAGTMLQFYTDDAPGLKISPNVVLVMSIGFIAFVAILHVMDLLDALLVDYLGSFRFIEFVSRKEINVDMELGNLLGK
ncbi:hypothetical protein Q3G72_002421 [Acer saccharum]|nr:hypothetical protein Q3G72_002421 [Acer saccharum]